MTLVARELAVPPNAVELAHRLGDQPGFSFLWSASGDGPSYLSALPLRVSHDLDPEPELPLTSAIQSALATAPRWIGVVPYEARRSLERPGHSRPESRPAPHHGRPAWWRFGAVARIDARVTVIGDDIAHVQELSKLLMRRPRRYGHVKLDLLPEEPSEVHADRVRAAMALIRRGEIYQVNLARRIELAVCGHACELLTALCRDTRPSYAAALCDGDVSVVSTSPELLLRQRRDGWLLTSPIKGTRPRGRDAVSDARLARELSTDEKERAELSMIVDVERNDLGRVSEIGSVRVQAPVVRTEGLVWHRRANVLGRLRAGVTRGALLEAMLPSGSVTGAPKVRAMEIIGELESARRGLYTGALGFISHSGELTLGMAIRTLTVQGDVGHYFTGGGIVSDSDPVREVEETRWKAAQLIGRAG